MTVAALALWLAAGPALADPPAAPATRVDVEVFRVGLRAGAGVGLLYSRVRGPLENGENPDGRAQALATGTPAAMALIHSTSWRWERDGRIVLTYLAWMKDGRLGGDASELPELPPPGGTDPLHPRPARIRELDPLAHGLRHLAFLLRTEPDGAVAAALGPRGVDALGRLDPGVAGELRAP